MASPGPGPAHVITLLTRPGCHLCDDARAVIERVAAIDVAKAAGKVCARLPGKTERRFSRVWDVAARTGAITELGDLLLELGIEKVTV